MTEAPTIPPDMWKVADIMTVKDDAGQIQVMFHVHPVVAFHALILRKPLTKQMHANKGPQTVEIPGDLSDEARLMLGSSCIAAIAGQQTGTVEYRADEQTPGMN